MVPAASFCRGATLTRPGKPFAPPPRRVRCRARSTGEGNVWNHFLDEAQDAICAELEALDGSDALFARHPWTRGGFSSDTSATRGEGAARVLEGGRVIEKGAVNVTRTTGEMSAERAAAMASRGRDLGLGSGSVYEPLRYEAAALSLVIHPASPHVPTLRGDVRRFTVVDSRGGRKSWLGGGCDLTPIYYDPADIRAFHAHWRAVCDRHASDRLDCGYPRLKSWCDDYFYLPSRGERRGTGGVFFDDLATAAEGERESGALDPAEAFARDVCLSIPASWTALARRRSALPVTTRQRDFQLERRARYVEFNLLHDRGVRRARIDIERSKEKEIERRRGGHRAVPLHRRHDERERRPAARGETPSPSPLSFLTLSFLPGLLAGLG